MQTLLQLPEEYAVIGSALLALRASDLGLYRPSRQKRHQVRALRYRMQKSYFRRHRSLVSPTLKMLERHEIRPRFSQQLERVGGYATMFLLGLSNLQMPFNYFLP